MKAFVRLATVADAEYIAPRLREADVRECDALLAAPPVLVIPLAIQEGRHVWTFGADGEPVGLFGVDRSPACERVGVVWMCSTPVIERYPYQFLHASRQVVDELNGIYPVLTNLVDARNTLHHRWLRWMGFSFLRTIDRWGARSLPFHEFARLKPCALE